MRRVTFELDVPIANYASFRLVERRTLTEADLFGPASFDMLVEHVKRVGCKYRIEEIPDPIFIDGNAQLEPAALTSGQ